MKGFVCPKCGWSTNFRVYPRDFLCPRCGTPLTTSVTRTWSVYGGRGLKRYEKMLALTPSRSIGEGQTPLVPIEYRGALLLMKLEYLNPGGSFKDRGACLALQHAWMCGYKCVVEDTSGNTGISVTLYAKIYGLRSTIVMPRDAPKGKKRLIELLGGKVIESKDRAEATLKAIELAMKEECYYVNHLLNPLFIEGYRTIAYEVFEEYGVPDYIIAPVGSGGLFIGIYRGFEDLFNLGLINKLPRMIAVQGVEVAPVYEKLVGHKPRPVGTSKLADGVRVQHPPRLNEIIDIIIRSRGTVYLVDDNEIVASLRELLDMGFVVEPTSAIAYAAMKKLYQDLKLNSSSSRISILIPLTGSGYKMIDDLNVVLRSS